MVTVNDLLGAKKVMKKVATKEKYKELVIDNEYMDTESYLEKINSYLSYRDIVPKTKQNHVGIELEFIAPKDSYINIMLNVVEKGLDKNVVLGYDGSIDDFDYEERNGYEIKIIDTEKNIIKTVKRVLNILSWEDAYVNETCGFHVHLDGRNRNRIEMYDKLYNMKYILYKMANPSREDNSYCSMPEEPNHDIGHHCEGIEITSKNTIEVRLHHGTLDFTEISNWIKLLLRIVKTSSKKNDVVWVKNNVPTFLGPRLVKHAKQQIKRYEYAI